MPRTQRGPSFLRPSFLVRRQAVSKGIFGGQRGWQVVAAIIFGRRLLQRTFGRTTEVLISETLEPGESMTIRTARPPTRAQRQRQRQRQR